MRQKTMRCPECGSTNVREVSNLHMLWQCNDCGYQDDGAEFDPDSWGSSWEEEEHGRDS